MPPILQVDHLSKRYTIPHSFREPRPSKALLRSFASPFSRFMAPSESSGENEYFWALKDITFDVAEGDVLGIIGRNGAGKSTLLKVISRITEPTEGRAVFRARMTSLLEVGTGFHPELTGRENIFLNGAILGMRKAEIVAKFDEIVAFAELERFLDIPVKHFSSGMYVRLAFAVAAHLNSEVLVVDEVLAVGDMAFQRKCLDKMNEVTRVGRTVLFVSHNMAAVANLCRRGIVLDAGKVIFDGAAEDAVSQYLLSTSEGSDRAEPATDLTTIANRRTVLLKQLEFCTDQSRPLTEGLQIGSPFEVRIHFELPRPTSNFNVGLGFQNAFGQRVLTAASQFEPNLRSGERVGRQIFTCAIPRLTLLPGEYRISVWLEIEGAEVDFVGDAAHIQIIESDYYGTGKVPWNGIFVLEHHWHMEPAGRMS